MSVHPSERGAGVGPFNQSPQARFPVVEQPGALPACCFACSGSYSPGPPVGREWFVDFGINMEFHGAVYLCNLCLEEMAGAVGWAPPDVVLAAQETIKVLENDNFHLRLEIASLHDLEKSVDTFVESRTERRRDLLRHGPDTPISFGVLEGGSEDAAVDGGGESGPSRAKDKPRKGTRKADEPGDGQGVADVHPNESSHEFRLNL